jgi:predicted transcriptional regulator YdeE
MRAFHILLILSGALALIVTVAAQTPAPKVVHLDEFSIVGIEMRTSGENEMSGDGVIGGMWQKFYQEHILDKIPNKADQSVYAVYTAFARGRMGEYSVIIGAKVKDKSQVPAGMVLKTIPAGQYAVLTSEKGPGSTVIPTAWQKVAALEDKDLLGGKRAYKADFEVYDEHATDPQNLQADLYVGLRSK